MTDNSEKKSIDLSYKHTFSEKLDLTDYDIVDLSMSRLDGVKEITFKDMAKVNMSKTDAHPKKLDVSMCDEIRLAYADLSGVEELIFKDAKQMRRSHIDTAKTDGVKIKSLAGNAIDLSYKNSDEISGKLDLTEYDEVYMHCSDLRNVDEIIFKEGANVDMSETDHLPKVVDVSMCSTAIFEYSNLQGTEEVIFRDAEQMEKSRIDTAKTDGVKIKIANKQVDVAALAIAKAKARGGK